MKCLTCPHLVVLYQTLLEKEVNLFTPTLCQAGECILFLLLSLELICPAIQSDIVETHDKSSDSETHASCASNLETQTKDIPPAVDIQTLQSSDVETISPLLASPRPAVPLCFGSRISPASVPAGRSDSAASRNRPAVHSAGAPNHAGWSNTQAPSLDLCFCWDDGILLLRPQQVTLGGIKDHSFGDPRVMGDPSTDNDIGIVDSGCSRSMTGNKEKLDDFVQIKGGIVKFGGGDGRISGKGTIRTSKLDFENVYYVEELQHFNLFSVSQICDKKNKVLFTDTDCLVLSEEFQLPDENQVVLRIPREHDLYTFSISDLQPEQKVTCLVAKASLDESTRWHRRMAHVNFKTINKLAKEAEAHPVPHSPLISPVREPTPERQPVSERPPSPSPTIPETEWVVPNPVSPVTDWRPWPYVPVHSPIRDPTPEPESLPTPPAQTIIFEEPLVFGPEPRPTGYVDPDFIEPIIFGPQPGPHGYVDPDFLEPIIFGPQPRPDNYLELSFTHPH
ncbi:ribonuclease H-like domain-containing protein [Tanacetum coccineum]